MAYIIYHVNPACPLKNVSKQYLQRRSLEQTCIAKCCVIDGTYETFSKTLVVALVHLLVLLYQ